MRSLEKLLAVGFTGDISFTGCFAECVLQSQNASAMFDKNIIAHLARNDWNIGNIEGALTNACAQKQSGVVLRNPPESVLLLKQLKIYCFNLANNHIMDCGLPGLEDTLALARRNETLCLGAGRDVIDASRPVILEKHGIKVGLLAVAHNEGMLASQSKPGVFAEKDDGLIQKHIRKLRASCDWVILNYHGGEEYTFIPTPSRRTRLLKYLDGRVDIVVAHHPHVVQGYEQRENGCVFYSLGNLIFDLPAHRECEGTDKSVIISLLFSKKRYDVISLCTKINHEKRRIESSSGPEPFRPINSDDYATAWRKEAWRIIADRMMAAGPEEHIERMPAPMRRALGKILRALGIIRSLKHPDFRSILLGACCEGAARLMPRPGR